MDGQREAPKLDVSLTGPHGRLPHKFQVGAEGGWIGRGRDCEIKIDDPDRFVSLKHARIDYAGGQFWLTDQSTNGTYLNDAATPIATGHRHPLRDGDHFRMGLFDLQVAADAGAATSPGEAQPNEAHTTAESDPLLEFDTGSPGAGHSASTPNSPLHAPDPLASLLSDLTGRPAVPEVKSSPDASIGHFVGPASNLVRGTAAPPPAQSGIKPANFATEAAAILSDGSARPSVPEASFSPDDSTGHFVGTASQLASRTAAPPPPQPSNTAANFATEEAATTPAKPPSDDMLNAMTAGIADLSPTLRPALEPAPSPPPVVEATPAMTLPPPQPPRPIDPAAASLAAFWCGVGIIPRQLGPNDLVDVMAEFGMAFREATEGFAKLLGQSNPGGATERNPLAAGHSGLRRYVEERVQGGMRLDEAVRETFSRNEQRDRLYRQSVQAAVEHMVQSLSARAIEQRFADMVRGRFARSRQAELWRLFRAFEKELNRLAQAQFQEEVEQRMRGEPPLRARDGRDGFEL